MKGMISRRTNIVAGLVEFRPRKPEEAPVSVL